MPNRRGAVIPGVILILLGGWLLAQNLNLPVPGFAVLWPGLLLIFGGAFLLQYFFGGRRDDGLVFVGVAGILLGPFFFLFTLERLEWQQMDVYWPVFVIVGGLAFLAQWAVNPSRRGLLVPAGLALLVGLVASSFTMRFANPALVRQLSTLWPVALILAGLLILVNYFLRGRKSP